MLRNIVPRESWQNQSQPRRTLRSAQTGKLIPCATCGEIFLNGDFCEGCGDRRLNCGFEHISAILNRLSFVEEERSPEQPDLLPPQSKPKPGEIQLKGLCCCGNNLARLGAGRKPHESSLHCNRCKKFIRWVSSAELKCLVRGGES